MYSRKQINDALEATDVLAIPAFRDFYTDLSVIYKHSVGMAKTEAHILETINNDTVNDPILSALMSLHVELLTMVTDDYTMVDIYNKFYLSKWLLPIRDITTGSTYMKKYNDNASRHSADEPDYLVELVLCLILYHKPIRSVK